MKIEVIKLGTVCRDKATQREGTVTHWILDMGKRVVYIFQPNGLNQETGQPLDKFQLEFERLEIPDGSLTEVDVPTEILGSIVTAQASGFTGMAVMFVRHINGCFHVVIQPSGTLPRTNATIKRSEFDLRECTGKMIPKISDEKLEQNKHERPSPTGNSFEEDPVHTDVSVLNQ
jgi:hypothetical protein